jgi:hypothetical protein
MADKAIWFDMHRGSYNLIDGKKYLSLEIWI